MMSFSDALSPYASSFGTAAAELFAVHHVVHADKSISTRALTRGNFWDLARKCATVLARDASITRGDHVVHYFGRNEVLDLAFRLAATMLGAIPVTVNWDADTAERVAYKAWVTGAKAVLFGGINFDRQREVRAAIAAAYGGSAALASPPSAMPVEINVGDVLVDAASPLAESAFCADVPVDSTRIVIFTSGTTGNPKGVRLSYSNYAVNAATFDGFLLGSDRYDGDHSADTLACFVTNPLHHTNSTAVTDWAMRRPKSRLSLLSKYTTQYWNLVVALRAESAAAGRSTLVCPLVARHLDFLEALVDGSRLAAGLTAETLKAALSDTVLLLGSAPVGPTTVARMQRFAGKLPTVRFGSTETCLQCVGIPCALSEAQRLRAFQKGWDNAWGGASQVGYYIGRAHAPHNEAKVVKSKEVGDAEYMVECAEVRSSFLLFALGIPIFFCLLIYSFVCTILLSYSFYPGRAGRPRRARRQRNGQRLRRICPRRERRHHGARAAPHRGRRRRVVVVHESRRPCLLPGERRGRGERFVLAVARLCPPHQGRLELRVRADQRRALRVPPRPPHARSRGGALHAR